MGKAASILTDVLLFSLAGIVLFLIFSLHKKESVHSLFIFHSLGVGKSNLRKFTLLRSLFLALPAVLLGTLAAFVLGLPLLSLLRMEVSVPALLLSARAVFILLLTVSLNLLTVREARERKKKYKALKVKLVSKIKVREAILASFLMATPLLALFFISKEYSLYKGNENQGYLFVKEGGSKISEDFINRLKSIPDIREVSAYRMDGREFFMTSDKMKSSEDGKLLHANDTELMGIIDMKVEGVYKTSTFILSDEDVNSLSSSLSLHEKEKKDLLEGQGVLYYQFSFYYDKETSLIKVDSQGKDHVRRMDLGLQDGDFVSLITPALFDEKEDLTSGNILKNGVKVLKVFHRAPRGLNFIKGQEFYPNMIFASKRFLEKIRTDIAKVHKEKAEDFQFDGYTGAVISFKGKPLPSLKKSVNDAVVKAGCSVVFDSYEIIENLYQKQSRLILIIFVFSLVSFLILFLLLSNYYSTIAHAEKRRIGIFQSLGLKKEKLYRAYVSRILKLDLTLLLLITAGIFLKVRYYGTPNGITAFSKKVVVNIYELPALRFSWGLYGLFVLTLCLLFFVLQWYPVRRFIKNSPSENLREENKQ